MFPMSGERMLPFQELNPEADFPLVHRNSNEITGLLPGCHSASIINFSNLVADCYTNQRLTQKSAFTLNSLFGVTGGRLRPFGFDFTKCGELATQLELKGSTLYL